MREDRIVRVALSCSGETRQRPGRGGREEEWNEPLDAEGIF